MSNRILCLDARSGLVKWSPKSAVAGAYLRELQEWLVQSALAGRALALPGPAGWTGQVVPHGQGVTITLAHGHSPVAVIAVARDSRGGAGLWRRLIQTTPALAQLARPPAPWVTTLGPVAQLNGLDAAMAWAWVNMPQDLKQKLAGG